MQVKIIPFEPKYAHDLKKLNYSWLKKYFKVEKGDEVSLSDPKKEIIDRGGFVFFAESDGKIAGAVALLKRSDTVYELGKMAVAEDARGNGIGKKLLEHCLVFSKNKGIEKLILYSNTRLAAALHLYRKYGFTETELEPGLYERADIKMEKYLT